MTRTSAIHLIYAVAIAIAVAGCGKAPAAVDVRFLAAEDACLAQRIHETVSADTGGFPAFALSRWRTYAAIDSSLNHAASPHDSARYVHHAALHQSAAHARDRLARPDFASEYTERLADVAATSAAQCRREAAKKSK